MPTYDYECEACGHRFEQVQPMSAKPLRKCPACGKNNLERLVTGGSGFILKGAGFWRNDSKARKGSGASSAGAPAAGENAGGKGEEKKPAEKPTEKPAATTPAADGAKKSDKPEAQKTPDKKPAK